MALKLFDRPGYVKVQLVVPFNTLIVFEIFNVDSILS